MKYYKVLSRGRKACHGGTGTWPRTGTWLEVKGEIVPCEIGLHLCRQDDLVKWLGEEIWEAEIHPKAEIVEDDDKVVVSKARLVRKVKAWNERTARLFAADCAEHVLHLFEDKYPEDKRPRQDIETARRCANGKATKEELAAARDAAWAAARDAARAAAWAAARDAERKWQTKRLMEYLEGKR